MSIGIVVIAILYFYGIYNDGKNDKAFIQITDRDDNIIVSWEEVVTDKSPEALFELLPTNVPDEFRGTYIRPGERIYAWNGQRVLESGTKKILDCEKIEGRFPEETIFFYVHSLFKDE
jgi:hypothetical protein